MPVGRASSRGSARTPPASSGCPGSSRSHGPPTVRTVGDDESDGDGFTQDEEEELESMPREDIYMAIEEEFAEYDSGRRRRRSSPPFERCKRFEA